MRKALRSTLLLLAAALVPRAAAHAADVCPGGSCTYQTIQAAIDAAASGAEIVVGAGTYLENIDTQMKPLTLSSESGAAATVIDGGNNGSSAVYVTARGLTTIRGFTIRNGTAQNGGGVHFVGGGNGERLVLQDCILHSNTTTNVNWGGGGAVLGDHYIGDADITIERCTLYDNVGQYQGGAVYDNSPMGTLTIRQSQIYDNHTNSGSGGGVMKHGGYLVVENSLLVRNQTDLVYPYNAGGAIAAANNYSVSITNSTIADNQAPLNGGLYANASSVLTNVIHFFNTPLTLPASAAATYSCIEGGWPGTGNIADDPRLVGNGDYHLALSSPCVDAGTDVGAPTVDLEGAARPQDGDGDGVAATDIGAYEHTAQAGSISIVVADYRYVSDTLAVHASSSLGSAAALRVVDYGDLTWDRKAGLWKGTFPSAKAPVLVTVCDVNGDCRSVD